MSELPPPGGDFQPPANPKAAAKAAKAYAKASRPWFKKKRWWILGAVVVLGIVGAVSSGGGGSTKDNASDGSNQTTTPAAPTSKAPTSEAPASQPATPHPKPPATWKTVSKLSGNTDKSGSDFHLSGCDTRLKYDVKGGSSVLVAFYVVESGKDLMKDGGFPVASPTTSGPGETVLHQGKGDYYIDVKAANATWSASVEQKC